MKLAQMGFTPLGVVDEGWEMGGTNGEGGGRVAGYGGGADEHVDELFNKPRGGAVDEYEEVTVIMLEEVILDVIAHLKAG